MKIAFVYDRINKFGGAERVLQTLHQIWPHAPIFTAVYNPKTSSWAKNISIKPSFLQKFPLAKTHHEFYPWLTPLAFESFNFDSYDVVISVTSAEAKAILTKPTTLHLCYCLTPTRYLWSHQQNYQNNPGLGIWNNIAKFVFSKTKNYLQQFDLIASSRPDAYIAISQTVQKRIKQYYHRSSVIIHPPVNIKKFSQKSKSKYQIPNTKYYLLVSRLTPYKKTDLAIKAFNKLKKNLIIVGSGRERKRLSAIAGSTISFADQVSDQKLINLYQHCQALIMPQEEDFGITAVEAMSAGKPVIAFNKGGAVNTIIHKKTGILFSAQTVDSLSLAVKQFMSSAWDSKIIKNQAKKFNQLIFKNKIKIFVEEQWQNKKNSR